MACSSRIFLALVLLSFALTTQSSPLSRRSRSTSSEAETSTTNPETNNIKSEETKATAPSKTSRRNKALNLFGYFPSFLSSGLDYSDDDEDDVTFGVNDDGLDMDDFSRTIPSRRRQQNKKKNGNGNSYSNDNINSLQYDNSPIFFIRLPPTPYMFVPGLGYISQPPTLSPPMIQPQPAPPVNDPFINLPIDFVSNGKPVGVYQWNAGPAYPQIQDPYGYGPSQPMIPPSRPSYNSHSYTKPKPKPAPTNSKITNLKGPYVFNGKPNDSVYVLRDTYNSLYSDALQNFYP